MQSKNYRFYWEGAVFEVGVSIGVAPIDSASGDIHALFQTADSACYLAKILGKNRIHIHGEDDTSQVNLFEVRQTAEPDTYCLAPARNRVGSP